MADKATMRRPTFDIMAAPWDGEDSVGASQIYEAANRGIRTQSAQLPYAAEIQRSFGRHDISGIQFHNGPAAAQSDHDIEAKTYATAGHVVSEGAISKHTAAHEAAHCITQQINLAFGLNAIFTAFVGLN